MPVYAAYKIGMTNEWLDTKLLEFQRWNHCKTAPPPLLLQRNSPTLLTTAKKQPHPTTQCMLEQPSTILGIISQAKEARLYTAAKQLKPPAKRAASRAMVKQNWHASRSRGLGLGTHNLPQNESWTILKPAWLQRRNSSSAEHSCMVGLTLILVISHDTIIVCLIV